MEIRLRRDYKLTSVVISVQELIHLDTVKLHVC